jgi:hypothetical protein
MAGTPSLKIKLRLNGPSSKPPAEAASPKIDTLEAKPSPAASNISISSKREASEPAQQSNPKRSRGGPGSRSKKNIDTAASTPLTKATSDSA